MPIKTYAHDSARYLTGEAEDRAYLAEAQATGEQDDILDAIGVVARARGLREIAAAAGLDHDALVDTINGDVPAKDTVAKILKALGVETAKEGEAA